MIYRRIKKIAKSHLNSVFTSQAGPPEPEFSGQHHRYAFNDEFPPKQPEAGDSREAGYYANLELSPEASFSDIKAAYRRLMSRYHPDKFAGDEAKRLVAEELTIKLNEAWSWFKKKHQG